jgi:hypothetical protein
MCRTEARKVIVITLVQASAKLPLAARTLAIVERRRLGPRRPVYTIALMVEFSIFHLP